MSFSLRSLHRPFSPAELLILRIGIRLKTPLSRQYITLLWRPQRGLLQLPRETSRAISATVRLVTAALLSPRNQETSTPPDV